MSNLSDILAQKKFPQEPPEFPIIRAFVKKHFDITPRLQLRDTSIIIAVPTSAVAGSLRFQLHELQNKLDTKYQLVIATTTS